MAETHAYDPESSAHPDVDVGSQSRRKTHLGV